MTVTTLEPTVIEHLDWEPACSSDFCLEGHPPATHIVIWSGMTCGCYPPRLACDGCAWRFRDKMAASTHYVWNCKHCGRRYFCHLRHLVEIRPLP